MRFRRLAAPQAQQAGLAVADSVAHLEALTREPMVVEHPDGALFIAGYAAGDDPRGVPAPLEVGFTWWRLERR